MRYTRLLLLLPLVLLGAGCSGPVTDSMIRGSDASATSTATPTQSPSRPFFPRILDPLVDRLTDYAEEVAERTEVTVPEDFPITLPFYAGATVTGADIAEQETQRSAVLSMWTEDDVETLNAWYLLYTENEGWELISESASDGFAAQVWKKGEERLVISLTWVEAQSRTVISIVLTQPRS